ncbi:MAG: hypothetical protein KC410_02990 [Anaerolineales bacterium]|uniref:toxin-antitoxin system protein n=1 Tax=Promineifilum sp. TaxID=2664178 RepID=UPI001DE7BF36|nr:hypothetical protein [Anaerolineales bacterium]MCO5179893.1 hypothetical protein [Promineifilum sp.]
MSTTTMRVSQKTRNTLQELSKDTGMTMQDIMDRAIAAYQRQRLLEATNAAYAALKNDPEARNEMLEERAVWDMTLDDALGGV